MKLTKRTLAIFAAVLVLPSMVLANAADVAKAARILDQVIKLTAKYREVTTDLKAPTPLANSAGAYVLPYNNSGAMTEWAMKTLNVQVGALAGEKAGEMAGNALASKVPFGGLLSGAAKKKGKEMGAVAAVGGMEFIKKTSDQSFNNLDDYAVHLHVKYSGQGGYSQALAAAMAIYPALETSYEPAIKHAVDQAVKEKKAAEKAAAAAAKEAAKATTTK